MHKNPHNQQLSLPQIFYGCKVRCCYYDDYASLTPDLAAADIKCTQPECIATMHARCVRIAHTKRNIVCNLADPAAQTCKVHNDRIRKSTTMTEIRLKHLTQKRDAFVEKEKAAASATVDSTLVPLKLKLRLVGTIAQLPLGSVLNSTPINEGGFVQRAVSNNAASAVERSMRKEGFDPMWGTIAVVEIPWTSEELKELKGQNLMDDDWDPPTPLIELCPEVLKGIKGAWQIDASDQKWDFAKRRFAIIDGNNRIIGVINTLADLPSFMDSVSLNAHLFEVAIEDSLMVQLASMYCNKMGGNRITDT